jgi:CheY-like chemotaxis protein
MIFVLMEKYGVEVTGIGSGWEAVELLKAGDRFDIVFLDIMMSRLSGIETFNELRKIDAKCRIVMMSAYPESSEWEEAEKLGVDLLPKPIPEHALARIISDISNQ